jgi:hypothetical protein
LPAVFSHEICFYNQWNARSDKRFKAEGFLLNRHRNLCKRKVYPALKTKPPLSKATAFNKAPSNIPTSAKRKSFESVERFYHRYYLRPKPILRIVKTMLEDKDVCVRRLREGYEFFKSMAQRRTDLEAAKGAA